MSKKMNWQRVLSLALVVLLSGCSANEKVPGQNLLNNLAENINSTINGSASDSAQGQDSLQNNLSEQPKEDAPAEPVSAEDFKQLITKIQQQLTQKGYKLGKADGIAGKNTRQAICQYQAAQNLIINPLPTQELLDHLESSSGVVNSGKINKIAQHQCEVAHINNLSNVNAVAMHTYEGTLTPDDLLCKQVVAPFELESNVQILFSSLTDNLTNIINRSESEIRLDELREKAKRANWLPIKAEMSYGQSIHEKRMEKDQNILDRNSKRRDIQRLYKRGDQILEEIRASLADEEYPYEFKLFVVNDRSLNAEAIPGGYLYVNSGVLRTEYAKLIISHELGHVLRRHTTKEMQARLIDSVETIDDLRKLLSAPSDAPEGIIEKVLALRGAIIQYSQQQELQADACAVRITALGQDPALKENINGYIAGIKKNHSGVVKKTSTHPVYLDREQRMLDVYEDVQKH